MKLLRTTALLALAATATACGPVEDTAEAPATRTFELSDWTGESTVTVVLTADDVAALDDIDVDSLVLTTRHDGPGLDALAVEVAAADDDLRPLVTVEVIDEQLADGVDEITLSETVAPAWRAPFMWRYSYSTDDCVDVTRNSFWHKVYVSIWSKDTSGSSWSSLVSNRKLTNGETLSRCDDNTYKLKVGVEARNTNHYSVEFND